MKIKVTIVCLLLLCLGWYQTVDAVFLASSKYGGHIKAAEAYEKKEIYEDALTEYQAALALEPESTEAKLRIANMYLQLDNRADFIASCEGLIHQKTVNEDALKMLTDYYDQNGRQEDIVSLLKQLRTEHSEESAVQKYWEKYRGCYEELYYSYEALDPFCGNTAVAYNGEGYGLIGTNGEVVFAANYDAVTPFSSEEGVAAVSENGTWYYMNTKYHKKIVPDEAYDYLGVFSEGVAVVGKSGKFGYADYSMEQKKKCEYDTASNFYAGVAAVEKGGKWELLGSDFSSITDASYGDVAIDEAGFCSKQERIFAKQKGSYLMLDTEGNQIGELLFEDAKPFGEDELTAVCMNGKWGFVNREGEIKIPCSYEDAKTFAYGAAPVKKDGKWGYVDSAGNEIIAPLFEDAYPFNKDSIAPVKDKNWFLIRLYALQ